MRTTGLALLALLGATAGAWAQSTSTAPADSGAAPAPGAPVVADSADSVETLDGYLDELSSRRQEDFVLDALSISDTEVDSLVRAYAETGQAPDPSSVGDQPPRWRFDWEIAALRYNRVEGANVMPGITLGAPTERPLELGVRVGYAWAAEQPTWRGELSIPILERFGHPTLEAAHSGDYYAYGAGGLPGNSLLALTAGLDLNDYYFAEGWSVALAFALPRVSFDVSYSDQKQQSDQQNTDFALFDNGERFRPNPPIDDGTARELTTRAAAGDATYGRLAGTVSYTRAGYGFGGDFDFDSVRGEILGRRPLWFGDEAKLRLYGGLATGDVPYQSLHFVGGTRLLRGYEINEFPTRKFAAASIDYKVGTNILQWIPYLRAVRVQFVPFFDAAALIEGQERDGTPIEREEPDWRMAAGLGVQHNLLGIPGGSGQVRLDVTRRLDRGSDNVTYRLGFTWER